MKELCSEIEIEAAAVQVWEMLTDFDHFPDWSPFIRRAKGRPVEGERLEVRIQPSGAGANTFKPVVLKSVSGRELRWLGRLLLPGLFDGEHSFTIEPLGSARVRFTQREVFTGLFVPLLAHSLDTDTKRGFEEMNQALRQLLEMGD